MTWQHYWTADTPIHVDARHERIHYARLAQDMAAYVGDGSALVLDHGCGPALSADRLAARCGRLYLCDATQHVREGLERRFEGEAKIAVVSPRDVEALPDHGLDLVFAHSLVQYLSTDQLDELLGLWHSKLREDGCLILGDVIPHDVSALDDTLALLRFAWNGGFLRAAVVGIARTALSSDAKERSELGLTQYGEDEMLALLRDRGFEGFRAERNLGHNQRRMTFEARPL